MKKLFGNDHWTLYFPLRMFSVGGKDKDIFCIKAIYFFYWGNSKGRKM